MTRTDATTLRGVSETALLTLRSRANEARRADAIIDDPMAIRLMDSIDYDFSKFGIPSRQDVAVRALAFDENTRPSAETSGPRGGWSRVRGSPRR